METGNNYLGQTLDDTQEKGRRLDAHAKALLADKSILAEIIQRLIPGFEHMNRETIKGYIEGTPKVGTVPVHPGSTNTAPEAITGLSQESNFPGEGGTRFDVYFQLHMPDSDETSRVYVNVEAQNSEDLNYKIEQRAVYYLARLISSQYGREFTKMEYQKLKKVFTIWIVFTPKAKQKNTISRISFTQNAVFGNPEDNQAYDLCQAYIVRLVEKPSEKSADRLIGVLSTLFSKTMNASEIKDSMVKEFGIPVSRELSMEVENMCNYSEGVRLQGVQQGIELGAERKAVQTYYKLLAMGMDEQTARDTVEITDEILEKYPEYRPATC